MLLVINLKKPVILTGVIQMKPPETPHIMPPMKPHLEPFQEVFVMTLMVLGILELSVSGGVLQRSTQTTHGIDPWAFITAMLIEAVTIGREQDFQFAA